MLQLLSKPKFSLVEKIKTIGSSYMVAAGLTPGLEGADRLHVSGISEMMFNFNLFRISTSRSPGSSTSLLF